MASMRGVVNDDELRAQEASSLHALPFDRDKWLVKIDNRYSQLSVLSVAKTKLPNHPAYVAVDIAMLEYWEVRYRDYGTPPTLSTLLVRALKAPKEIRAVARALHSMEGLDAEFVASVRSLIMADKDGATARKRATRAKVGG
jgi:hypothetical protein